MITTDIVSPVMTIVNASTTYGVNDDTKKYPPTFLSEMAIAAADEVCGAICVTQNHPLRGNFKQTVSGIADEAFIVLAGFEIYDVIHVEVDGQPARIKPWTYIDRMRNDPLSRTSIPKYYALRERKIKHNGTAAVCDVIAFQKNAGVPQAPDSLLNACISGMLKMVSSKMGVGVEAASYYAGESARHLERVRGGAVEVPEVTAYNRIDQAVA
jgi:hypothetical protein